MSQITQTDIARRVCQKVGAELIAPGALLTEDSKPANEIRACYDVIRRAELRRNVWRFSIRTVALRPIDTGSKLVTFGTYAAATAYSVFDIVVDPADGQIYYSRVGANTGNVPSATPSKWVLYFGSDVAFEFVTTFSTAITYMQNDHAVGSDGTTYFSVGDTNLNHNPVGDGGVHWKPVTTSTPATTLSFFVGEIARVGNNVFVSQGNNNVGIPGTSGWLALTTAASVQPPYFIYPIGAGPASDFRTKNSYKLPCGFMREAPQDPKAGQALFLGAPDGSTFEDWNFENQYFTSDDNGVITFRFAADIQDVTQFDPLFVEGFVCRISYEVCEPLTQSEGKKQGLATGYKLFMTEAREVNGIEDGPTYPPEDSYITCRF